MVDDIDVDASSIISDPMAALSRVQENLEEKAPPGVLRRLLHIFGLAFFVVLGLTIAFFLALILAPAETQDLLTSLLNRLGSFRASW